MSTETENDNLELGFKPNYKELKRWKKTLDKYKEEFDSQYIKIKEQFFEEIAKGRLNLIAEIAEGEKLDYEMLKKKYIKMKPEIKKKVVHEEVVDPQCELLTKKKTKTGREYYTNGIENSNITDGSGKVIGKYIGDQPIFIN